MNKVSKLLAQYGQDHQNPINKNIHVICIPLILWSLLGLLHALPTPEYFHQAITWELLLIALCLIYYVSLNMFVALLMLVIGLMCVASYLLLDLYLPNTLFPISLTVFIGAWLGQFLGHKIEGSKPAFFSEIKFLLIGPLWTLSHFIPLDSSKH